ncbi:MAG TPA: hypothetical protein VFH77_06060 [Streptomyces sp.]|nr:hypothetical protein [Streptomyces sp.]
MVPSSEVARAVREGPFETALSALIDQSGLTLDRVRDHLAKRGVRVSRATLSYWRQGRSRPERSASLDAVTALEELFGLPNASLLKLLGPRRPRGPGAGRPAGVLSRSELWPPAAAPILTRLAAPREGNLVVRSVHDVLRLGPERSERSLRVRLTVEAMVGPAYRMPVYYQVDDPARGAPRLARAWYGRPGRTVFDRRSGLMVAEILFDHPLGQGELAVVEYELEFPAGPPLETFHRRFGRPVGEYVLVVGFGDEPPAWCHRFVQRSPSGPEHPLGEVWVGGDGYAQSVTRAPLPGTIGMRWCWG